MAEPLAVLIIGCGRIAGGWDEGTASEDVYTHAGAYARDPGYRVVACIEPDAERRQAFMRRWRIPRGYTSLTEWRADGGVADVVSVCVPTPSHAEVLRALLPVRPRLVFTEKPLADDLATAAAIVDAYHAAEVALAVNYLRRWDPAMAELRRQLAAGDWGRIQSVSGWYTKGIRHNGGHLVDLLAFLIGPLRAIAAWPSSFPGGPDGDPTLHARLEGPGGVPVSVLGADHRAHSLFEVNIVADGGLIQVEDAGRAVRLRRTVPDGRFPGLSGLDAGSRAATGIGRALPVALTNFQACLNGSAPLASSGDTALAALRLTEDLILLSREEQHG